MVAHHPKRRPQSGGRARRGLSTLTLLIVAAILLLCCGVALDTALIGYKEQQLDVALEAAARAGAAQLLCPLPLAEADFDQAARVTTAADAFRRDAANRTDLTSSPRRVWAARQQAVKFAALNVETRNPVKLDLNPSNDVHGDIVIGWIDDPGDPRSRFQPSHRRCNTVKVQIDRTRVGGNPLATWFASRFGLGGVDRSLTMIAHLDQRVYGFRPLRGVNVPLLPVAVGPSPNDAQPQSRSNTGQSRSGEDDPSGEDQFTVHRRRLRNRPDGTPEVAFIIPVDSGSEDDVPQGHARLMRLGPRLALTDAAAQCRDGLSQADLAAYGGYLARDHHVGMQPLQPAQVTTLQQAICAIRGQQRIWPVTGAAHKGVGRIQGFAAGWIIDAYFESELGLVILVQPCGLLTSTALTGPGVPRHPQLGKVVLVN